MFYNLGAFIIHIVVRALALDNYIYSVIYATKERITLMKDTANSAFQYSNLGSPIGSNDKVFEHGLTIGPILISIMDKSFIVDYYLQFCLFKSHWGHQQCAWGNAVLGNIKLRLFHYSFKLLYCLGRPFNSFKLNRALSYFIAPHQKPELDVASFSILIAGVLIETMIFCLLGQRIIHEVGRNKFNLFGWKSWNTI